MKLASKLGWLIASTLLASTAAAQEAALAAGGNRLVAAPGSAYAQRGVAPSTRAVRPGAPSRAVAPSRYEGRSTYRSSTKRIYVPGRYETVRRRVWIPDTYERVWVDPVYSFRTDLCGLEIRVLLREGTWRTVRVPGHFEDRHERVWRPGHWQLVSYGR